MGAFNSRCSLEGECGAEGWGGDGEYVLAWQPMIDPLTFIWAYTIPEHKINSSEEK